MQNPDPNLVPSADSPVLFEVRDAVGLVTLNRPAALNSFTPAMHQALWAALDALEANDAIRAVVFTGAGRGFCAGADLANFDFAPGPNLVKRADPGPTIEQNFNRTARRLMSLRFPTICAVNGVAAGAGASFVMNCDMAIAAPTASFVQAFSKIGLIPDAGSSWFLPRRVGMAKALGLAFTGDKFSAADAKAAGMIWDVADDPVAAALALGTKLAAMPTQALVATRKLMREGEMRGFGEQLDMERETQHHMGKTHDYIEGVSAFLQKRPAQFKGQ
jgi:2-(1,2-epoxy-1,2-dihydrophenyl)acetyl-CoA isomerase